MRPSETLFMLSAVLLAGLCWSGLTVSEELQVRTRLRYPRAREGGSSSGWEGRVIRVVSPDERMGSATREGRRGRSHRALSQGTQLRLFESPRRPLRSSPRAGRAQWG